QAKGIDSRNFNVAVDYGLSQLLPDGHSASRSALGVKRELLGQVEDFAPNTGEGAVVGAVSQGLGDPAANLAHLLFPHSAGGHGRRADADAAGLERRVRVEGNCVLIYGDSGLTQSPLSLASQH